MKRTSLLLFCLILIGSGAWCQTIKVGAAKRSITPDPLLPVSGGVGTPRDTEEKRGDLFARATVWDDGSTKVAVVGIDNLGWPAVLADRSRQLIDGIAPENILIAATHTHSAPDAYGFPDEKGNSRADMDYLDWCVEQIAAAVNEAIDNMEPAHLKIGYGEAKGKIAYNFYAPQLYDPNCGVIQAIANTGVDKGKTIMTLVNYAIHPEVIGSGRGILSPDICGPLYDRIENKSGGMALFINGALGGMVTADNRREEGKEANDWEECIRIGELLADEALRIVAEGEIVENAGITAVTRDLELPIESEMMKYILMNSPLKYKSANPDFITTQLNLVQIGPAQIITVPGEALPNIGYYLKRNMPTDYPFLFGLTNDAFGYIMTKVDFNSFKRYEYISRTSLGEMTGEIFIDAALKLIKESVKQEQKK